MKKKTKIGLGVAAAVVVVLGATAAFAGPAFYRDVVVGEPELLLQTDLEAGHAVVDGLGELPVCTGREHAFGKPGLAGQVADTAGRAGIHSSSLAGAARHLCRRTGIHGRD